MFPTINVFWVTHKYYALFLILLYVGHSVTNINITNKITYLYKIVPHVAKITPKDA